MAFHDEEQHGIFNSLIGATKYAVDEWFSEWEPPENVEEEPINLNLFYPLLMLGGELYECSQKNGHLTLRKRNHIQFRKSFISEGNNETYQIDVITEMFLKNYLGILETEINTLKNRFRRQRKNVYSAIQYIVAKAKAERPDKIESFRDFLEFNKSRYIRVSN